MCHNSNKRIMEKLIGRKREIAELQSYLESDKSEAEFLFT